MESARLETPAQYEHLRRIKDAIPVAYSFRQTAAATGTRERDRARPRVLRPLERDLACRSLCTPRVPV